MKQPEGFIKPGYEDYVCKLVHTIYGTMQGGHDWYKTRVSKSGHGPVFCHFWPRPRPLKKIYCTEWARPGPVNRSCTRPVTAIGKRPVLTGLAHSEGHSCPRLGLRVPY